MEDEIDPKEEYDPQIYDFMHYTEGLPKELFTYFVKQHLDENRDMRPIWNQQKLATMAQGSPTMKSAYSSIQSKQECP